MRIIILIVSTPVRFKYKEYINLTTFIKNIQVVRKNSF